MMRNNGGLEVTVNVPTLMSRLKQNRDKHRNDYALALEGYVDAVRKELTEWRALLNDGKFPPRSSKHAKPEDYTSEYDSAISMLEWTTDTTISLDQAQFEQYVEDNWGWKQIWSASNSAYAEAASTKYR